MKYSTLTPEQIARKVEKARLEAKKESDKQHQEEKKRLEQEEKLRLAYPPTIATISKRIKRIDPWNTVVRLDPYDANLVIYYKLKQRGVETDNIRFAVNNKHCWIEFKFADHWYILDLKAIATPELGAPLKNKKEAEHNFYKMLTTYYNLEDYLRIFEDKIEYSKDEAKVLAMEDEGLQSALVIKYH